MSFMISDRSVLSPYFGCHCISYNVFTLYEINDNVQSEKEKKKEMEGSLASTCSR